MKDTGRIKMESYNGILYCDAYMKDDFSLDDLNSMRDEIRENYASNTDVILKKSASYSVSVEAQMTLFDNIPEFRHFVYVVDNEARKGSAEYAAVTYMMPYKTQVVETKEAAYAALVEIQAQ